jgi:hypothetical protein
MAQIDSRVALVHDPRPRRWPARGGPQVAPQLLVAILALAFSLFALLPYAPGWIDTRDRPPTWMGGDPDATLIHIGLRQAPHFADTLRWWTGRWVGQLPYYRPLTSYGFWLEWKAFGDREWLYLVPTTAAHVLAALMFTLLAYRLAAARRTGWPAVAAIVAAWGYSSGFPGLFFHERTAVDAQVFLLWKNQPDAWAATCCFAALICYFGAQQGARAGLVGAMVCYAAGCGFKELVVPLWAVFLALELDRLRGPDRVHALRRLLLLLAVGAAMVALRSWCVHGFWYSYARNGAWAQRTVSELLGPVGATTVARSWLGNGLGVWTFLIGVGAWSAWRSGRLLPLLLRSRWLPVAVAAGLLILGWTVLGTVALAQASGMRWQSALHPVHCGAGLLMCFESDALTGTFGTLLCLASIVILWRVDRGAIWLALIWSAAFLAPLTFSPGNIYRYYLPQDGYLLMVALAAGVAAERLTAMIRIVRGRAYSSLRTRSELPTAC